MIFHHLFDHLTTRFANRPDVFLGRDLFWHPEEEDPEFAVWIDLMLVFGRPNHPRTVYKQWEEDHVPPTVLFAIDSSEPCRLDGSDWFYACSLYGVQEYYCHVEDRELVVGLRQGDRGRLLKELDAFVSPRLGIRLDFTGRALALSGSDGALLETFAVAPEECDRRLRVAAEERAARAHCLVESLHHHIARLAELGRNARHGKATPEELAELEQLEAVHLSPRKESAP